MISDRDGHWVDAVRHFNRFYTRRIGVLDEGHLQSPFSLVEVRVLYELAHRDRATAAGLCRDLDLDAGYVSRILRRFTRAGLIRKARTREDRRQTLLTLTPKGRRAFEPLNARAREQVSGLIGTLSPAERDRLVSAMRTIETLLGSRD